MQRGRCGSTEGMCSMDVDGTLYPCQKFIVNQTLSIGNIYSGFNEVQRDIVQNYLLPNYLEQTRQCKSCEAVNYCFVGCIADNYLQDTNQLQDCDFRRLHQNMHKKFYDELIRNNIAPKRYDSTFTEILRVTEILSWLFMVAVPRGVVLKALRLRVVVRKVVALNILGP